MVGNWQAALALSWWAPNRWDMGYVTGAWPGMPMPGCAPLLCHVLTGVFLVPEHKAVDYHGVPGRWLCIGPGEV